MPAKPGARSLVSPLALYVCNVCGLTAHLPTTDYHVGCGGTFVVVGVIVEPPLTEGVEPEESE